MAITELWIVSAKVAEWESEPLTACAVTVEFPVAVVAAAPKIMEAFAPAATVNGLPGLDVTPAGRLASVISTEPAKPFVALMETMTGWLTPPWGIDTEAEESAREKSGEATTAEAGAGAEPPLQPERRTREKRRFTAENALRGSATAEFRERYGQAGYRTSGLCLRMDSTDCDTAEPPCWARRAGGTL